MDYAKAMTLALFLLLNYGAAPPTVHSSRYPPTAHEEEEVIEDHCYVLRHEGVDPNPSWVSAEDTQMVLDRGLQQYCLPTT